MVAGRLTMELGQRFVSRFLESGFTRTPYWFIKPTASFTQAAEGSVDKPVRPSLYVWYSYPMKKNNLFLMIGPPRTPPTFWLVSGGALGKSGVAIKNGDLAE